VEASSADLNETLRSDGRGATGGRSRNRLRRSLVVVEVALSLMLLAGAGLLMKSFMHLRSLNPGFDSQRVLTVRLSLPAKRYANRDAIVSLYDKLRVGFEKLPGVEWVGATSILPLSGPTASASFQIVGRPAASQKDIPDAQYRMIDWAYFPAMRTPLLRGRNFSPRDTDHTQAVAIVSESAARQNWPDQDAVGAHILVQDNPAGPRDAEVVGVVGDVRMADLESAPAPTVYVPMQQIPHVNARWIANNMFWVIRTAQSTGGLEGAARRTVQSVDGDVAASSVQPLETYLSNAVASRRFSLSLMAIFAAAALLLAASGLYALISHFVAQRQREIGVRMALGAQPRDIFLRVVGEGLLLTAAGVTLGLAGTFAVARLLSTMLFGVTSYDPITIVEVALLLTATAVAASYFPARRALSIDPVVALRDD
jgi:putative ABC transport system permease protein